MRIRQIIAGEKGLPRTDVIAAVSFACNLTKEQIFCSMESEIDEETLVFLRRCLNERMAGRPIAYITGTREFYSEKFFVNKDVLIPRPETELLVDEAMGILSGRKGLSVLDMGTGSGAIGIIIAKHTENRVVCVDISEEALAVAKRNARSIGVSGKIDFIRSNLFDKVPAAEKFDLVAANLPYVPSDEWDNLMVDVREYEPRQALDGGERGVEFYERFAKGIPRYLNNGGHVLVEIGSSRQADEVGKMLECAGLTVTVKKDHSGRERVLAGHG